MGLIHLVRHAEPTITGVLLGRCDPPICSCPGPSGIAVQSVFSSPLLRAQETASALFPNHPARILASLTEITLGEWDGLPWEEIQRRDPRLAAAKLNDWLGVTPPGGESYPSIIERATGALQTIRGSLSPVAIVAHSGINAVLWHLLTDSAIASFRQEHLEVITYES